MLYVETEKYCDGTMLEIVKRKYIDGHSVRRLHRLQVHNFHIKYPLQNMIPTKIAAAGGCDKVHKKPDIVRQLIIMVKQCKLLYNFVYNVVCILWLS